MKRAVVAIVLCLAGCAVKPEQRWMSEKPDAFIWRYHDAAAEVTCWVYAHPCRGGLSCLPDAQVAPAGRTDQP